MATIRQVASGLWQAIVRRKGYPAQSKTFERKSDAALWASTLESEIGRGVFISRSRAESTTVDELIQTYINEYAPHHYRGQAWRYKLAAVSRGLGSYSLAALTPQIVGAYRDARLQEPDPRYKDPKTAPRLSGATVKTEIDILSKVMDWAMKEQGFILPAGNPVAYVRKPANGKARDRRLNAIEWGRLVKECGASGNRWLLPAVELSVETAMRQGELLRLTWDDVDFDRRIAMLHETKNGDCRAAPLSTRALLLLDQLPRLNDDGRVIPLARMTLYGSFGRAVERAGIKDYTWHDLRHESLSRLAERGDLSVLELSAVSGHKTLQMLKRYTHLQTESLARKLG